MAGVKRIELVSLDDSGDDFQTSTAAASARPPPKKVAKTKITARKTMSSFTPLQQIRKLKPDVIDLDSDDGGGGGENKTKKPSSSAPPPPPPATGSNAAKSENGGTAAANGGGGSGSGNNGVAKVSAAAATIANGQSKTALAVAIDGLHASCKAHVTAVEFEKIRRKLDKKTAAIPSDQMGSSSTASQKLVAFIDKKSSALSANPKHLYTYLREVLDELSKHAADKKALNAAAANNTEKSAIASSSSTSAAAATAVSTHQGGGGAKAAVEDDDKVEMARRKQHIRKLEKTLKACGREIERLDEADLGLDDLDNPDSTYIKISRYQNRYMQIYRKIAELKKLNANLKRKSDTKIKIETSRILEVNEKIQDLVNKKRQFPDFADVHGFYKQANEQQNLGMSKDMLYHDAKETFITVGKLLKARRIHDYQDNIESYFAVGVREEEQLETAATDPAEADETLKTTLSTNHQQGKAKLDKLLDDYSRKQIEAKEEPEPVPDDEPVEKQEEEEEEEGEREDVIKDDNVSNDEEEEEEESAPPPPPSAAEGVSKTTEGDEDIGDGDDEQNSPPEEIELVSEDSENSDSDLSDDDDEEVEEEQQNDGEILVQEDDASNAIYSN